MDNVMQLHEQAMTLYRAGRFEEAAHSLSQVSQLCMAHGEVAAAALALNDQGVCWRQAARFEAAEHALREAERLFRQVGDVRGEAQVLGNLGALYAVRRDDAKAIGFYRQAADLLDGCNESELLCATWMALGRLRMRRREWLPAFAAYEMGLSKARQLTLMQRVLRGLLRVTGRMVWRQSGS